MATSWAAIEDAIMQAVRVASGLSAVLWTDQNGVVRPGQLAPTEQPFATCKLLAAPLVGHVGIKKNYDNARPAGQEVEVVASAVTDLSVGVQFFVPTTTGDASAMALAARTQLGLRLPSVRNILTAAGIGLHEYGSSRNVTALLQASFEGRSSFDLGLYVTDEISEFTGYIAEVLITDTGNGRVIDVGPVAVEIDTMAPENFGNPATITLGPAAGTGAAIVASYTGDRAGWVRLTLGTSPGGPYPLFTVHFSRFMDQFVADFSSVGTAATSHDIAVRLSPGQTNGNIMDAVLDPLGPDLNAGDTITIEYQVTI